MKSRFYIFFVLFFILSCQVNQGDRQAMVQALVDKKLEDFRLKQMKACHEKIEIQATRKVDTMLIDKARLEKEKLVKPMIPTKPNPPEIKTPFDTSDVAPIIQ